MSETHNGLWSEGPPKAHHARLLALLRELAFQRKEITLASGRQSDFYIDCRAVVLSAEGHFLVGWLLNHAVRLLYPDVRVVAGMALGAAPLASAVSTLSGVGGGPLIDALYVRREAKTHGTASYIEGRRDLAPGTRVVVLEDVVTSGGSCLVAVDRLLEAKFEVVGALALVDRCEGGRETIEARVPLHTLYRRSDFIED